MQIIYNFTATDGKTEQSSLSHYTRSYSEYPNPFVAGYWSSNGE